MSKRLVSITDANQAIGLGHAMRQLGLVQYAKKVGWDVSLYSASSQVKDIAEKNGIHHLLFPSLQSACKQLDDNIELVVDVHQRDLSSLYSELKSSKAVTLISDVGYDYPVFGAHIVLVGNNLDVWSKDKVIVATNHEVVFHSGRKWMIFRDEFSEERPPISRNPKKVLVCHGGSDPHGLTELTLHSLNLVETDLTITVLATDNFPSLSRVKILASDHKYPVDVIVNASSVRSYMEEANFAIINGGNVRYELCLVGTPYIAISFQQAQYEFTQQLSKQGIGVNLGLAANLSRELLAASIIQFYEDQENKIKMNKAMKNLFDLQGSHRILDLFI